MDLGIVVDHNVYVPAGIVLTFWPFGRTNLMR